MRKKRLPPDVESVGVPALDWPDEEEVYQRACAQWERTNELIRLRAAQRLVYSHGPVCHVYSADWHLGGSGVDYPRLFGELELVAATPGMRLVVLGDLVNQFVIGKLRAARDNAALGIVEEWALVRRGLRIVGDKLDAVIGGNHEGWAEKLIGVDYFREVVAAINPEVLYDADDSRITLQIGDWEIPARFRHKWAGFSIYNDTHGIERAAKWDQDFVLGVGAHFHRGGQARPFTVGGQAGMAVTVGTYKTNDRHARRGGFPLPGPATSVAVLFDEDTRSMTGFQNLEMAAKYMREVYG